jgi:rhamnulose-1-phosphate aldolase
MTKNMDPQMNFTNGLFQKVEISKMLNEMAGIAQYLWEKGWAEGSAGNFSINVTGMFSDTERDSLSSNPVIPLSGKYPDLARALFLVSGTGTRMREMADNPMGYVCFVYVGDSGSDYHLIAGNQDEGPVKPTSELATHLGIQRLLIQQKSTAKVVLHAHVTELIALTQLPAFKTEEAINALFWSMHPETMLFVPEGIGFIPYTIPGTETIARATLQELGRHKAIIWEKHGCIAVGANLTEAFDILDILAKSAKIYFLCKSTGIDPEGLSTAQTDTLRTYYSGLSRGN